MLHPITTLFVIIGVAWTTVKAYYLFDKYINTH